ncbi:MAG: hypothetical protein A2170_05615 [Deltaproteobacteria bacterium RBG_13_53_10]|nr:MAG: hypothetical protein A2170_05615 [Deltaproteobacteria bacterium RBG_13_53_10]
MHFAKIFVLISLSLAIGLFGCTKEQKVEAPKQERITKNLVPEKAEAKSENFLVELSDLNVGTVTDIASKEIIETPNLQGHIKITNISKDILDIQAVTFDYLDEAGKPIAFKSGEKIAKVFIYFKAIKPGEAVEGSLDNVTIPRMAIKDKSLAKIEMNVVYVPSPLKREIATLSEKVE